jgi:hypothetical protein
MTLVPALKVPDGVAPALGLSAKYGVSFVNEWVMSFSGGNATAAAGGGGGVVAWPVTTVGAGGAGGTVAGAGAAGMVAGAGAGAAAVGEDGEDDMQPTAISEAARTEEARVRFMFQTSKES